MFCGYRGMIDRNITKSIVEDAAPAWLEALGYAILHGPDIASGVLQGKDSESIAEATA